MRQDWEVKKLGDICISIKDGSHNPPKGMESGCYIMLSSQNIQDGYIDFNNSRFISEDDFHKERKRVQIKKGDLLLTIVGTIGRICVFDGSVDNIVFQRSVAILSPKTNVDSFFLRYFIKSQRSLLEKEAKGVAQKGIYLKQLSEFNVQVPPLQTQQQIVEELDCLTSIIEKQKKQLEELDNLAQSIFYDMFGDPIENEKGWEVKNLNELCDVRDGTHDSPKYLIYSDYILITSKNIANGKLDFTNVNYISKADFDKINLRSKVDKGDILMAMIGTIGNPIIVNSDNINFCIKNMALIKLTPNSLVHRLYLHSFLFSKSFNEFIKRINKGGTQKFITLGTIRKLLIPVPPLTLQQQFASKIEAIEKQKELIKKSIKETEDLFNSRMDYYFN